MTNTDLARSLLRDVEVHTKNEKFWKTHDTGFTPYARRRKDNFDATKYQQGFDHDARS